MIRVPASSVRTGDRLVRWGSRVTKVVSGGQGVVFHLEGGGILTAPGHLEVAIHQTDPKATPPGPPATVTPPQNLAGNG